MARIQVSLSSRFRASREPLAFVPPLFLILISVGVQFFIPSFGQAASLQRSAWECTFPCEDVGTHKALKPIRVSYCAATVISQSMLDSLKKVCDQANSTNHAVAVRTSGVLPPASCVTSGNACESEGLVDIGFTCNYLCPSEDRFMHKISACASSMNEAWAFATEVCKDAKVPSNVLLPELALCTADGQSLCASGK